MNKITTRSPARVAGGALPNRASFLSCFKGIGAKETPLSIQHLFLDTMAPAHPEHYASGPYPTGIVDTIG